MTIIPPRPEGDFEPRRRKNGTVIKTRFAHMFCDSEGCCGNEGRAKPQEEVNNAVHEGSMQTESEADRAPTTSVTALVGDTRTHPTQSAHSAFEKGVAAPGEDAVLMTTKDHKPGDTWIRGRKEADGEESKECGCVWCVWRSGRCEV